MSRRSAESQNAARQASAAERVAHLVGISSYLNMSTMAIWGNNPRAERMLGMVEASLRYDGPDERDDELLRRVRDLFAEAQEYRAKEEFPAMMARLRVAYDLVSLGVVRACGD